MNSILRQDYLEKIERYLGKPQISNQNTKEEVPNGDLLLVYMMLKGQNG